MRKTLIAISVGALLAFGAGTQAMANDPDADRCPFWAQAGKMPPMMNPVAFSDARWNAVEFCIGVHGWRPSALTIWAHDAWKSASTSIKNAWGQLF